MDAFHSGPACHALLTVFDHLLNEAHLPQTRQALSQERHAALPFGPNDIAQAQSWFTTRLEALTVSDEDCNVSESSFVSSSSEEEQVTTLKKRKVIEVVKNTLKSINDHVKKKTKLEPPVVETSKNFKKTVIQQPVEEVETLIELKPLKKRKKYQDVNEITIEPVKKKKSKKRIDSTTEPALDSTMDQITSTPSLVKKSSKKSFKDSTTNTSNEPFRRVKTETIQVDPRLTDNSFTAKSGAFGSYGEKANRDLIVTRGAGFTKQKNKMKRGSYRGGEIDMQSHSIKF